MENPSPQLAALLWEGRPGRRRWANRTASTQRQPPRLPVSRARWQLHPRSLKVAVNQDASFNPTALGGLSGSPQDSRSTALFRSAPGCVYNAVAIRKDATGSNIMEISILQYCPVKCDPASQSQAKWQKAIFFRLPAPTALHLQLSIIRLMV